MASADAIGDIASRCCWNVAKELGMACDDWLFTEAKLMTAANVAVRKRLVVCSELHVGGDVGRGGRGICGASSGAVSFVRGEGGRHF